MIKRNTAIPFKHTEVFSTHHDGQQGVGIKVYEGMCVVFSCIGEEGRAGDNRLLAVFQLSGIPKAAKGVPQVEVTFSVDGNGILTVDALDSGTGRGESLVVVSKEGVRVSRAQVEKMRQDTARYEIMDIAVGRRVNAKISLQEYAFRVQNEMASVLEKVKEKLDWIDDLGDSSSADEIEKVQKMLEMQVRACARRLQ